MFILQKLWKGEPPGMKSKKERKGGERRECVRTGEERFEDRHSSTQSTRAVPRKKNFSLGDVLNVNENKKLIT
jgi:hypothetical protein